MPLMGCHHDKSPTIFVFPPGVRKSTRVLEMSTHDVVLLCVPILLSMGNLFSSQHNVSYYAEKLLEVGTFNDILIINSNLMANN